MNAPFSVQAETEAGLRTVSVSGELDQGTAPELRGVLSTALGNGDESVLIDLSECAFIDSTGLSLLVEAKRRLAEEQRHFGVCCAHLDVRRLLELTGIDEAIGLFETRDEAVARFGNGSPGQSRH